MAYETYGQINGVIREIQRDSKRGFLLQPDSASGYRKRRSTLYRDGGYNGDRKCKAAKRNAGCRVL